MGVRQGLRIDGCDGVTDEVIPVDFGRRESKPTTCCRRVLLQPASTHFSRQTRDADYDSKLSVWVCRLRRARNHNPRLAPLPSLEMTTLSKWAVRTVARPTIMTGVVGTMMTMTNHTEEAAFSCKGAGNAKIRSFSNTFFVPSSASSAPLREPLPALQRFLTNDSESMKGYR